MIRKALTTFLSEGATAEIRIINAVENNGYTANYTGFFNDIDKMVAAAKKFSGKAPAVYFTLQQCKPEILARANNRMAKAAAKNPIATKDTEIEKYNWLPIDLDAKRTAGISATDAEHESAKERARAVCKMLTDKGWPMPVVGDSGNGAHLCYRIDLPNTEESKELVKKCLIALSQLFSDDAVEVDKTVFNPARIWKLYGTKTMKGDATDDRPHRMAMMTYLPPIIELVDTKKLQALAAEAKEENKAKPGHSAKEYVLPCSDGIDVAEWCKKHDLRIGEVSKWLDAVKYQLLPCPFNADHFESLILKHPSGAVSFKCSHNGCSGKTWQDLRDKLEPKEQRQTTKATTTQLKPSKNRVDPRINVDKDLAEMEQELEDQHQGKSITIPLPWHRTSDMAKAFRPGSLTILAGPSKKGKSFFAQNIVQHVHRLGYSWAYLPLEDTRQQWMWRQLAVLHGDYRMIDVDQEGAEYRRNVYAERKTEIVEYLRRVSENPRIGLKDEKGETVVPEVPHAVIVDWIREQAKKNRFLIVDPVSQIDSDGKETWKAESWFMRQVLGVLADTKTTLLLLTHTIKRSGLSGQIAITAEDVQGSSMFVKLAHTTLLLDGFAEHKEGMVYRKGGEKTVVKYDKVVTIAASRNGAGTGSRIAFLMNRQKPEFEELGILISGGSR
jgi:hypothetical protein